MRLPRWMVPVVVVLALAVGCSSPTPAQRAGGPVSSASTSGAGSWPAVADRPLPADRARRLQAQIDGWVSAGLMPGVTAALVTPEGAWAGAAGVDGRGNRLVPTSGMALASITKTFTAAEVMLLAEQGRVELEAPASRYLDVPQVANGTTVRQLLAQRSGVAEGREAPLGDPDGVWSVDRYLSFVPAATEAPGGTYRYDNTNFVLLGRIVEQVRGLPVDEALATDLWEPAGLERLAYQGARTLAPPLALPPVPDLDDPDLDRCTGTGPYLPCRAAATLLGAAGGMSGDAETVARWGYTLYGGRLLRPESVARMTDFSDGDEYGLGTMDLSAVEGGRHGVPGVGHLGNGLVYRTVLAVLPETRTSVAILVPAPVEVMSFVRRFLVAGSALPE